MCGYKNLAVRILFCRRNSRHAHCTLTLAYMQKVNYTLGLNVNVLKYLHFHSSHYNVNLSVDGRPKRVKKDTISSSVDVAKGEIWL